MNDLPVPLGRSRFRFLCLLLFCSGMTSLIFQIIWLRGFSIILGSTIYSMACVVTVFMLGLAVGSLAMSSLLKRGRWLAARLWPGCHRHWRICQAPMRKCTLTPGHGHRQGGQAAG